MENQGRIIIQGKLKLSTEKVDSHLIQHLTEAAKCEKSRVIVISNETDDISYCLTYENIISAKTYGFVLKQEKKPQVFPFTF